MSTIMKILSWLLTLIGIKKKIQEYHTPDVTWIKLSRADQRSYYRYCKRKGMANLTGMPEYVTARCHDMLKRRGIIK